MPRLQAAQAHPVHTVFTQHDRNPICPLSSGNSSEQIGHSSSSDLVLPLFISTSWFPAATHSSHLLMLCLRPRCPSLYAPSGRSRSQAPQIIAGPWIDALLCYPYRFPSHVTPHSIASTGVRLSLSVVRRRRRLATSCQALLYLRTIVCFETLRRSPSK